MCLFLFFSLSFFFYITILQPFSLQYQRHRSFCDATFSAEASSSSGISCTQAIPDMLGHMCIHGFLLLLCVQYFFSFFVYFFSLLFSVASVQFPTCTDYNITYAPVVCSTFSRLVFNFSGVSVLLLTDNDCRCIAPCACLHIHNE